MNASTATFTNVSISSITDVKHAGNSHINRNSPINGNSQMNDNMRTKNSYCDMLNWLATTISSSSNVSNVSSINSTAIDDDVRQFHKSLSSGEVVLCFVLSLLILIIIVGNSYVILSVTIFEKMRTLSNGLIASLASADLLVAIVVLPLSLHREVVGRWTLGPHVCDLWLTADVFCCTASILNIVVIAVDRYWLITKNVRYTHSIYFPRRKACIVMLTLAWTVAALISCSPLLGWRKGTEKDDPNVCLISQDYAYTIISTFGAFWFPLVVILAVYFKIFHFARQRAIRRCTKPPTLQTMAATSCNELAAYTAVATGNLQVIPERRCQEKSDSLSPTESTTFAKRYSDRSVCIDELPPDPDHLAVAKTRLSIAAATAVAAGVAAGSYSADFRSAVMVAQSMHITGAKLQQSRRVRRSARTLGLIIGGFLVCWMPFFLVATVMPFCPRCQVPPVVASLVLWLGYSNSLLNPAIYAIWDKSFRKSFKRLTVCDVR